MKFFKCFFNFITAFLFIGLVFFARPISSYANDLIPTQNFYKNFVGNYTGFPTSGHKYSCVPSQITYTLSFSSGSPSGYFNSSAEIYVVTSEGCFLAYSGSSNSSSVVCTRVFDSSDSFLGYPIGLVGVLRSSRLQAGTTNYLSYSDSLDTGSLVASFTVNDITSTDPELSALSSIKQDTSDILTILNSFDLSTLELYVGLINQYTQLINTSVDNIEADTLSIKTDIREIAYMLLSLKKSVSYSFPSSIDGNYQLSTVYLINNSLSTNNEYFTLGKFAFDFSSQPLDSTTRFVVRVPDSHKLLILVSMDNNFNIVSPDSSSFFTETFNNFSPTITSSFYNPYIRAYYISIPDRVPNDSFISFCFTASSGDVTHRLACYDYVVGANDILNYLEDQWDNTRPGSSDLNDHNIDTGDLISDVNVIDTSVYTDFDSAYSGTGINGFDWSVFGGMIVFSTLVNNFWGALSSEFSLYIVAILIIGCAAVLLSAVARITKKGD